MGTATAVAGTKYRFVRWFQRHKEKLWWIHSGYALLLGIGVMWLGAREFAFLRVAVIHVFAIWLLSLFLPSLIRHPRLAPHWAPRITFLANFLSKNLYQQVLFFVLPIYYASATLASGNFIFVALVGLSAMLATLDIIYDRYVSVKRSLTALFFAFNLFVLINVMLPVLWSLSNTLTTRISAAAASLVLISFYCPIAGSKSGRVALAVIIALPIIALVEVGRPYVPPVPLRLVAVQFGADFNRRAMQVAAPVTKLSPARAFRLYGLTAIRAPLGLKDRVRHRWYLNGKLVWESPLAAIVGGRAAGFRYWTRCYFHSIPPGAELHLDVVTEGGQLIGRGRLKATNSP